MKKGYLTLLALLLLCGCGKRELEDRCFPSVILVADGSIAQEMEQAQEESSLYLDFGHAKAVLMDETVLSDREALKEVLLYLEQNPVFARNMLMFSADSQVRGEAGEQQTEIGSALQDLYKNQPADRRQEGVTLQDMLNYLHNQEPEIVVPHLVDEEGKIFIRGELKLPVEKKKKQE